MNEFAGSTETGTTGECSNPLNKIVGRSQYFANAVISLR